MVMGYKCFMIQLVLFLGFTYVLSSAAAPATGSPMVYKEDLLGQNLLDEGLLDLGEGFIERRMDLEINDYPDTGANPEHNPKAPGRA